MYDGERGEQREEKHMTYMCHGIESCKAEDTLKESQDPSGSVTPPSRVDQFSEHETCGLIRVGRGQTDNHDDYPTDQGPPQSEGIEVRKEAVCPTVHGSTDEAGGSVHEEDLVSLRCIVRDTHGCHTREEVAAERSGSTSQHPPGRRGRPARDPGDASHVLGLRKEFGSAPSLA